MEDEDVESFSGEELANQLTGNFRFKLRQLSTSSEKENSYKDELGALQTYVSELSEQNEILVQTIEDLESDSNERVISLENKLIHTSEFLKEQTNMCEQLQHQINRFEKEKEKSNSHFKALEEESITMGEESIQYQTHIGNLENDVDQLIYVIKKARTTGKWELSKMDLKAIPLEKLLDSKTIIEPLPRNNTELATENHVDELMVQLRARDETIIKLERELKKKTEQYHSVLHEISHSGEMVDSVRSDVNHLEKKQQIDSSTIAQKDILIHKLKNRMLLHEESQHKLTVETDKQHEEIMALKQAINDLESSSSMYIVELDNKSQSIQILERQLMDAKEKSLFDSLRDDEVEDLKVQLHEAQNKIGDLQHYINDLKITLRERETKQSDSQGQRQTLNGQVETIKSLQHQLKTATENSAEKSTSLFEVNQELGDCKKQLSRLEITSNSKQSEVETNLRKDIDRKEREIKTLEVQIKRLEEQKLDGDSKTELRDRAIDRLQNQQKEYMEEVTRRDGALHSLELKLLKVEDEKRRNATDMERLTKKHDLLTQDYTALKMQHNNLIAEKGKVDAKLKVYQISNESEQSALTQEVSRREELIQKLRQDNLKLDDIVQQASDSANFAANNLREVEAQRNELIEKISTKEKIIIDRDLVLSEMKSKLDDYKQKVEANEDETREIILRLNTAERAREQEAHQCAINKEYADELTSEVEHLQEENRTLLNQFNSKTMVVDELSNELSTLKKVTAEKEKQFAEQQEFMKLLEKKTTSSSSELSDLKRETANELASRDRKIGMLQEEVELSQQRYADVNEELTNTELQLEAANKNYRQMYDLKETLEQKLQTMITDVEQLEMALALTAEKHKTSVQQNAQKDGLVINLQSELDATQQEFENVIEEIGQKTEENQQLTVAFERLKEQHRTLQVVADDSSRRLEEYVEQINELQTLTIKQQTDIKQTHQNVQKLRGEAQLSQEKVQSEAQNLEALNNKLKEELREKQETLKDFKIQIATINEKNAELIGQNNTQADERESAVCKLNELRERYEDLKLNNESKIDEQSEKIITLEAELHSSTLKVSKLDGSLQLAEEKLKNSETQLFDTERHASSLENQVQELKEQLTQHQQNMSLNSQSIENLEENNQNQANQLHQQTLKLTNLQSELKTTTEALHECKLRNTRCEEIIREMREKLSTKLKEADQQNKVLTQQDLQISHLEDVTKKTKDKLMEAKKSLSSYQEAVSSLREDCSKKQEQIETLESTTEDMDDNLRVLLEEKQKLHDKNVLLQDKFENLKCSLEKDNFNLLEENCTLKQHNQDNDDSVRTLEEINRAKTEENAHFDAMVKDLKEKTCIQEQELNQKKDELFSSDEAVNELHEQFQVLLEEKKVLISETSTQLGEINQLRLELTELRQQYRDCSQQLAHYQEKSTLSEKNLTMTQEQLSTRIAEIVKLEKLLRKVQSDLKKISEDKKSKDVQIGQYKQVLEQNNADLKMTKHNSQQLKEENNALKSALVSYESQLEDAHNQTEQLSIEIESKENTLKETENVLDDLQCKVVAAQQKEESLSKLVEEQQHKLAVLTERETELLTKIHDREGSNDQLHSELESCLQKNKSCLEKVASKDAEMRVLKADLHAQQKKCAHQDKYLKRNTEQIERYQQEVRKLQDTSQDAVASASNHVASVDRLNMEMTQTQAKLDECMEQLSIKSKDLANTRTELTTLQQQQNQTEQQYSFTDSKNKRLKTELKKALERNKTSANEMAQLVSNNSELKFQLQSSLNQQGNANEELNKRDQQIITLKVELAATDEKLKMMDEENDRLKNESLQLSQQHHRTMEQLHVSQQELSAVKTNSDRLTRESELVVDNMNNWVKEQRQGNEKVASKLSQQNNKIGHLESTSRSLNEENERLRHHNSSLKKSIDERKSEKEKFEKQRTHTAEFQVHIHELQGKIQNLEDTIQQERDDKAGSVSELQSRVKSNMETIQQLHKQLSELNKENLRQRTLLERQSASRKNLQAQLKSKDNDFELLNQSFNDLESTLQVSALLGKELDKTDLHEVKDKKYWQNRVGELSNKLQQNEDYWSKRVRSVDASKIIDSDSDF